jgi:hypothetical protein
MNVYQKIAVFGVRCAGFAVFFVGVIGPFGVLLSRLTSTPLSYPSERWTASLLWIVLGIVAMLLAKRIGRLLGNGLD